MVLFYVIAGCVERVSFDMIMETDWWTNLNNYAKDDLQNRVLVATGNKYIEIDILYPDTNMHVYFQYLSAHFPGKYFENPLYILQNINYRNLHPFVIKSTNSSVFNTANTR